jgi:hypothetical protein
MELMDPFPPFRSNNTTEKNSNERPPITPAATIIAVDPELSGS